MNDPKSITVLTNLLYDIVTSEIIDDSHNQLVLRLTPLPQEARFLHSLPPIESSPPH